ncbi:hypothetical protein H0N98_02060 [Candidatus Micrarchaeota archaeon]|nr:hypothetical protein [Candidatus Micrarchaeota archaeon]
MRAQISFEFFIAFFFLLLFFILSFIIYQDEMQFANLFMSAVEAQSVASDFSRAINGVYQCGSGCSYKLQLKDGYYLAVRRRVLEVSGGPHVGQASLVSDNVNIQSATPGRYVTVINNKGVVELHDA